MKKINRSRFNNLITLLNEGQEKKALVELNCKESKNKCDWTVNYQLYGLPKSISCQHFVYKEFFSWMSYNAIIEFLRIVKHKFYENNSSYIQEVSNESLEIAKLFFKYSNARQQNSEPDFNKYETKAIMEFILDCQELLKNTESFYLIIKNNSRIGLINENKRKQSDGVVSKENKNNKETLKSKYPLVKISGTEKSRAMEGFDLEIDLNYFPSLKELTASQIKHRIERWNLPFIESELLKQLTHYYYTGDRIWEESETEKIESVLTRPVKN
jgi:hypothetical protein